MSLDDERYADRIFWRSASPYMRLLGVEVAPPTSNLVEMSVAPNDRIACSLEDGRPHPLILSGLADDCLSFAIGHSLPIGVGILTLDMWLSFAAGAPDGSVIHARGSAVGRNGDVAIAQVQIEDAGGSLLSGNGTFLIGRYPSGKLGNRESAGRFDASCVAGPFADATGLCLRPDGASFSGKSDAIIGWEAGPAVHGGATAGLLHAACCAVAPEGQRIKSLHVRYLRPAIGSALRADAELNVTGARASHVSAHLLTADGKIAATCSAVFAPAAD